MKSSDESKRPLAPSMIVESIPVELKSLTRWVGWQYEFIKGMWDTPPLSCRNGRKTDVTELSKLTTFDVAVASMSRWNLDGVGFAFHSDDPYTGIDLDNCRDPGSGRLQSWAGNIVSETNSYTEVSPSGTGVHIIVRGKKPVGSRSRKGNIEVYSDSRYFTVTGQRLDDTPAAIEERQAGVVQLIGRMRRTDEEIIALAGRSPGGEKFARL